MSLILFPHTKMTLAQAGGKVFSLYQLQQASFLVPAWFVVLPQAFIDSLAVGLQQQFKTLTDRDDPHRFLEGLVLSDRFQTQLTEALNRLCPNSELVAVRSSAIDEDGAQHSFAGQLDSYLFVPKQEVAEKVIQVWRSGYSERVMAYRRKYGMRGPLLPPAVLIQKMVNAESAGVAFGVDPVSGDATTSVIASVYGLGSALVSGESNADTFYVDQAMRITRRDIVEKTTAHRIDRSSQEGVSSQAVESEKINVPSLSNDQILEVAALARHASEYFGKPQDIEWAIEDNQLYLLQSRPITTLQTMADGELNIWDNSNIVESYGGITTPLTFSFARHIYEEIYRQFCRILKVSPEKIETSADTFKRMLGLIRGRVYYNLLSWYRVLALLPGYKFNRGFMEQMMGVKEALPQELVDELGEAGRGERIRDALRLINSVIGLVNQQLQLRKNINTFYARLNDALNLSITDLQSMSADQLAAHYRLLEQKLLTHWDAPLVNDFFAMIFYGVLRKLCEKWCADTEGSLQNNLLCGAGGMISTEPAQRIRRMARLAMANHELVAILCRGNLEESTRYLSSLPEIESEYHAYLEKFGDRCLDELKLESTTLNDDPAMLLQSIGHLARKMTEGMDEDIEKIEEKIRFDAEQRVTSALGRRLIHRLIFAWVLKNARARVRDRENLRFERTRLFGHVRRLFLEMGKHLHKQGHLQQARDIFYLEVQEIIGFVHGTTSTTRLVELVNMRRKEFESFRALPPPADRFKTHGTVHAGNDFTSTQSVSATVGDAVKGIGCCPGVVRGLVRVVVDPRAAELKSGEILVAERTDPGWVMLFTLVSGLLVERGSLLSHSAIVAREMAIPAVVSIPGLTQWLKTGDEVEFNGTTGEVRLINQPYADSNPD